MQEMQFQCRADAHRSPFGDPFASHLWLGLAQPQNSSENERFAKRLIAFISDIYATAVGCPGARDHSSVPLKAHARNLRANRAPNLPPRKNVHLGYIPTIPPRFPFTHTAGSPPAGAAPPRQPAPASPQ